MPERALSNHSRHLYLTTTGRSSGRPREIEIWYTRYRGRFYVISSLFDRAHWIRNIRKDPRVGLRVGGRRFRATARILEASREDGPCVSVRELSEKKYGWSEGLIVELVPSR